MAKLLYELESDFLDRLDSTIGYLDRNDVTVKELLDEGFNNAWLKFEGDSKRYNLGFKGREYMSSKLVYYSDDFALTPEQLNCRVRMTHTDQDGDGYTIIYVALTDPADKSKFVSDDGTVLHIFGDETIKKEGE